MLALTYMHRLPADYEMARIRARAAAVGSQWDGAPGLFFKAILLRERGEEHPGNAYASFYLWQDAEAMTRFLTGERFAFVERSFGRPRVFVWPVLGARTSPHATPYARVVYDDASSTTQLGDDADATVTALDPTTWRQTKLLLDETASESSFELAYLARGTATLRP